MIKTVFRFPNGMVVVLDENGQQIAELQGKFEDVKDKIEAAADEQTEWNGWKKSMDFNMNKRRRSRNER